MATHWKSNIEILQFRKKFSHLWQLKTFQNHLPTAYTRNCVDIRWNFFKIQWNLAGICDRIWPQHLPVFCDFFQFCDVVWWLSPERFSFSADKFWENCQNSKKTGRKTPPLQLETVSKCDGISSKFGEICQEFVTERSF
jgi:hypothetical protein